MWTPIGGAPGYRIKSKKIDDIEEYKFLAKGFAFAHLVFLMVLIGLCIFNWMPKFSLVINLIFNSYCIMTQRYTCIRINEILEKYKELEKRREEKQKSEEEILDFDLSPTNQFEKLEEKEQISTSIETYSCEKNFETFEPIDSDFESGFTRVLKK